MTTEIAECAWCGKEPTMTGDLYVYCNNRHCVQFDYADNGIELWNQHQENFLAQRRKDFEAGHDYGIRYRGKTFSESDSMFHWYMKAEAEHGEEEKS